MSQHIFVCEGSYLRKWKQSWFVLYTNGVLKYFGSPDSNEAKESFPISTELLAIKTADQVVILLDEH